MEEIFWTGGWGCAPPFSLFCCSPPSSLQNCILCLSELGDHFLSYMPRWLLEFLAPRKLEGKKKSNIYRMPGLISWNGGIWSERKEKIHACTRKLHYSHISSFISFFSSPLHPTILPNSLALTCLPWAGRKTLRAEQRWQDKVATHKLRQRLDSSLTVWGTNNAAHCVIISHCCC